MIRLESSAEVDRKRPAGRCGSRSWQSYDDVAEVYDEVVTDTYRDLARDLIVALELAQGAVVLDVGSGTGAAAAFATTAVGAKGVVMGLDPSIAMLKVARTKGIAHVLAAEAPGLPLRSGRFDAAFGNLVLSHFKHSDAALADLVRILRPGGRLGLTSWAAGARRGALRELWGEMVLAFISEEALTESIRQTVPGEGRFGRVEHLVDAFSEAGLARVEVRTFQYRVSRRISDYLAMMESSTVGRYLHHTLSPERWETFKARSRETFYARMSDPLEYAADAFVAIGTKP